MMIMTSRDDVYDGFMPLGEEAVNVTSLAEPDGHFTVATIRKSRSRKEGVQYLVTWERYPDDDTWQTYSGGDFSGCDEALVAFHQREPLAAVHLDVTASLGIVEQARPIRQKRTAPSPAKTKAKVKTPKPRGRNRRGVASMRAPHLL